MNKPQIIKCCARQILDSRGNPTLEASVFLCDGTVVPCCLDSDGVIALGNLFCEDLEAILNSERARAMVAGFRCGVASEDLCRRCGYAQRFV